MNLIKKIFLRVYTTQLFNLKRNKVNVVEIEKYLSKIELILSLPKKQKNNSLFKISRNITSNSY